MIHKLKDIEINNAVESIAVNDFKVWCFLRIYIGDALAFNKDRTVKVDSGILKNAFTSIWFGFGNIFKKQSHLIFSDTKERRLMNNKYTDKSVELITDKLSDSVIAELPLPKHFPKNKTATKEIFSRMIFYVLTVFYAKIFLRNVKIENEELLQKILKDYDLNLNYNAIVRKNIAQYHIMKRWIQWKKLKSFTVVCSYTNMGYVKAFKDSGLKVIEVQHGIINENHFAYNVFKKIDDSFYPDFILTYGLNSQNVFGEGNYFIPKQNAIPVGHNYIDFVAEQNIYNEKFSLLAKKYKRTVAFTSQDPYEDKIIPFLKTAAALVPDLLFVFIPRTNGAEYYKQFNFPPNIQLVSGLNNYELIKLCDIHSTLNSTCAIEAPALGKPNILLDIEGRAKSYYGKLLSDEKVTQFVNTPSAFAEKIFSMNIPDAEYCRMSNKENILPGYKKNLESVFSKLYTQMQ